MAEQIQPVPVAVTSQQIPTQFVNVEGAVAVSEDGLPVQIMMPSSVQAVVMETPTQQPIETVTVSAPVQSEEFTKATSKKELSKQWKSLCKRAKQWCSMHDDSVPNFVMMYLDENRLVWEGPDHMETFISDEGVISAFLRTAALSESLMDMEKRGADVTPEPTPKTTKKQKKAPEMSSETKPGISDAEILASLMDKTENGESKPGPEPIKEDDDEESHQSEDGAEDGSTNAAQDDDEDDDDDDVKEEQSTTAMDQSQDSQEQTDLHGSEADVLSQVIESVIKDWDPKQGPPPTADGDGSGDADNKKKIRLRRPRRKRKPHYIVHTSAGTFEIVHTVKATGQKARPGAAVRLRVRRAGQEKQLFTCEVCGKTLSRNNMAAHMRIHKGDFKFFCDVCQKGFYTKKDMTVHYRIHTGEKPYSCSVCFKTFRQKSKVTEHMLTHSHEKKHICEYCSQKFARRSDLKCHIRLHTGERPYACSQCGKKFAQPGNYSAHLRTHSKQTYVCEYCAKSYASIGGLKEHMRVHSEKKASQSQIQQEAQIVEVELTNPLIQHQSAGQTHHQVAQIANSSIHYTVEQHQGAPTYTFHQQPTTQTMLMAQQNNQPSIVTFSGQEQEGTTQAATVLFDPTGTQQTARGQVLLIEQGNQQTHIVMS